MATTTESAVLSLELDATNALPSIPAILLGTEGDDLLVYYQDGVPAYSPTTVYVGAVITGYGGNDMMYGSFGDDPMGGGAGNDWLNGYYGNDSLNGGDGIDTADFSYYGKHLSRLALPALAERNYGVFVDLGSGYANGRRSNLTDSDSLTSIENAYGSDYDDTIFGSATANVLQGRAGNDIMFGLDGADLLDGGKGDDRLVGDLGDDYLLGSAGNDRFLGGDGIDTIDYSYLGNTHPVEVLLWQGTAFAGVGDEDGLVGIERVIGTVAGDHIEGDDSGNALTGAQGNDWLVGRGGNDTLDGGEGDDSLVGGAGADGLDGGLGNDTAEYIESASGVTASLQTQAPASGGDAAGDQLSNIENLKGSQFDDSLAGDDQANTLMGFGGRDMLFGGQGDDHLFGDDAGDQLFGMEGFDWLSGGEGADLIDGGADEDTLVFNDTSEGVTVNLTTGRGNGGDAEGDLYIDIESAMGTAFADRLIGNGGNNAFLGSVGNDVLDGRGGADMMDGGDDNDAMLGGAGDDVLWGNYGRDKVAGGTGDDYVSGNRGGDTLTGNAGLDVFVYYELADSKTTVVGRDTITDFARGEDVIDLEDIDAKIGFEQLNQAFDFIGTAAFSNTAGELRYSQSGGNTLIEADVNGNGVADFAIQLTGTIDLLASDFVL